MVLDGPQVGRQGNAGTLPVHGRPRNYSRNAEEQFRRHGLPLLSAAKCIPGLDAVMPAIAGAGGVSVTAFLALDTAGSSL